MAISLFEVEKGFLHNGASILAAAGAPSGIGDTGDAGVGSVYQDTTNGSFYIKHTSGAGAANWKRLAGADEISTGVSWREPVVVIDTTTDPLPTGTATQTIDVDGVTISDGDRVLFAGLTGGDGKNVYIYNQASGTFTEDSNNESEGDTVYVEDGTGAGRTYVFDGTDWIRANQANLDEEGFIRAFVGKGAAGNELPNYSSTVYVTQSGNLETAIGELDAQVDQNAQDISQEITDRTDADTAINNELTATQTGAGLNANGTYSADGGANYISTATSLKNADSLLDAQVKSNADDISALQTSSSTQAALLARARTETSSTAVTTAVSVDTVLVDSVAAVKWIVHVQGNQAGDAANKQVVEILAAHDGTASADATDTDYTVYSKLRIGADLTGLTFAVDVSGTGAAQTMRLRVSSTTAVDVRAARETIEF